MNCEDLLKELTCFSSLNITLSEGYYLVFEENECIFDSKNIFDILKFLLKYIADNLEDFWL